MMWTVVVLIVLVLAGFIVFLLRSQDRNKKNLERLGEEAKPPVEKPAEQETVPKESLPEVKTEAIVKETVEPAPVSVTEDIVEAPVETVPEIDKEEPVPQEEPSVELPSRDYPKYDNARAVEQFGLSQEEADIFIVELIEQIENEIPGLETAITNSDFSAMEEIIHMIKGSSSSLGTGGVTDVLEDFNNYCKEGNNIGVATAHMDNLKHYLNDLKLQFGS